jgi:hypothetical protein
VDEGKMGDLKVAEAEVENEGVVVEGKTGKRIFFQGVGLWCCVHLFLFVPRWLLCLPPLLPDNF